MATEVKKGSAAKMDFWLKVVPISLTAIGLFFGIYKGCETPPVVNLLEQQSWQKTRDAYENISEVVSDIIIAKNNNNDTALKSLYNQFNTYRIVKLKTVNESKRVNDQMTNLYLVLDDAVNGREDILNPNSLEEACRHLADSIRVSISEGDSKYGKPQ